LAGDPRPKWVRFANFSYDSLLLSLFQPHPRASAVLVDEFDADRLSKAPRIA
jgi:hypothetical protein